MIVKCSHCQQIFSAEKFDAHECDMPLNGCKRIEVVYFQDGSYKDKKIMNGWGTDGVLYTFEVVPRKAIPLIMAIGDEISHGKKKTFGDGDFTESYTPLFKL